MDRASEGDESRQLALNPNFIPIVRPKSNRANAWQYDHAMYKPRNEIERLFRRLKRFDAFLAIRELDVMFIAL
jgi:hypothetical protein